MFLMESDDLSDIDGYPDRPSKSQLKRDDQALQKLARELAELSAEQLTQLNLDENLHQAILQVHRNHPHSASRQRQIRHAAGFLRKLDVTPITTALDRLRGLDAESTRRQHLIERWRDRILADGDTALAEFMAEHPRANRQQLRQLLAEARRERDTGSPPRAARLLFKRLRDELEPSDEG